MNNCSAIQITIAVEPTISNDYADHLLSEIKYLIEARMQKTAFRNSFEVFTNKQNTRGSKPSKTKSQIVKEYAERHNIPLVDIPISRSELPPISQAYLRYMDEEDGQIS